MAIIRCSCENKQQDELHGAHNRVANKTSKATQPTYRCTVCKKEAPASMVVRT